MKSQKTIGKYKGWTIKKILSGKAKGMFFAKKGDVSFGILGDNTLSAIKMDIKRREKLKEVV
jgi:hypothetical protein